MINFVLNDLCRPAGKGFDPSLKIFCLPLYLDRLVAFALSRLTDQRQTSFLGFIQSRHFDNFPASFRQSVHSS